VNGSTGPQPPQYTVYVTRADGKETIIDARQIRIETASGEEVQIFLQRANEGVIHFLSPMEPASEQHPCGRFTPLAIIPCAGNSFYLRLGRDPE